MKRLLSRRLGDINVSYSQDPETRRVEWQMVPAGMVSRQVKRRNDLADDPAIKELIGDGAAPAAIFPDSVVQAHIRGDALTAAFAGGLTMRNSGTVGTLEYQGIDVAEHDGETQIRARFSAPGGVIFEHLVRWSRGETALRVQTLCRNASKRTVTLDMLSSFSLGGLSPFQADDAPERLVFHRFRSYWSSEGRLESRPVEELHLERSWSGHSQLCERFGTIGSQPVRKWFPFAAVEDLDAAVTWAVQIATPGSWQIELYRRGDTLALSGGQADREFGHWWRTVKPGEEFLTPEAWLTVSPGGVETAAQRLQSLHRQTLATWPESEQELSIVANEWCTSWGNPTHENLVALADRLRDTPVRVLVIDDGWAERPGPGWQRNGDWVIDRKKFPNGLAATADAIRERGLIPGLWFEFEVCNPGSKAWKKTGHHLKRDGGLIEVGPRRFWDFRDPWVHEMLAEKVIRTLRDNRIGYLKVDYNDTIGFGCDGADSPGEGLRQHLEGVQRFCRKLRAELPELIIENCASGGHRTEPSMIALTAMTSFSDAHETTDIPIIAANLQYLIPPRQSQIWAVLRAGDSIRRLCYSLSATLLGRMCISGSFHELSAASWKCVRDGMDFYRTAVPVIREGTSQRFGPAVKSYRHPTGWQAVLRQGRKESLLVFHTFASDFPRSIEIELPAGLGEVVRTFGDPAIQPQLSKGRIRLSGLKPFQGWTALLR